MVEKYGSYCQVWKGKAEMTREQGLTKKDIIRVKTSEGTYRYKSKEKHNQTKKNPRSKALVKARKELINEGILSSNDGFIPMGGKTEKGKLLLKRINEILNK
jgi:hypothetical protein